MNISKQTRKIIKSFNFDSKEVVYLSDSVSYEIDNYKIINLILEKEINKIQGFVWQINSDSINSDGEYIGIIGRYLHNEMLNNKDKTLVMYNKYLAENNIPSFHDNVDITFAISEIAEIIAQKLVKKNDNYLTQLSVFHSSTLLKNYQKFFMVKHKWLLSELNTRKDVVSNILDLFLSFQNKYIINKDDFLFPALSKDSEVKDSFPFDFLKYNNNASLKENVLSYMNKDNYNKFIKTKS